MFRSPRRICALTGSAVFLAASGCNTIKTTHVAMTEGGCGWTKEKFHGLPITVRLPNAVRVTVTETYYVNTKTGKLLYDDMSEEKSKSGALLKTTDVAYEIIETPETFFVDTVRPAAGTLSYGATIDPKFQYPSEINSEIDDQTINSVKKALDGLVGVLPKPGTGKKAGAVPGSGDADLSIQPITSEVAVKVFPIRGGNLEENVRQFLYEHITNCRTPCPNSKTLPLNLPIKP